MHANVIQITDNQATTIRQALYTVPAIALGDSTVLRTATDAAQRAVPALDLDALAKTIANFGECMGRTLRAHEATAAELHELRQGQRALQHFLGTYREPAEPGQGQS